MHKRLPYYLILSMAVLCIVAVSALPQAGNTQLPKAVSGAVIQSYEPTTTPIPLVTVCIKNTSGKTITGYNIYLRETYADGHIRDHQLSGDISLPPGETRKEIIGVQPGLQNFQAVITVVAYDDLTVEATDDDAFQRLNSTRKLMLTTRQAVNDDIKAALADPNDRDPAATAAKKVQDRINAWNAQKHRTTQGDFLPGAAQGTINDLKGISSKSTDKRNALVGYLGKSEEHVKALLPHANLTKIGGRP